MLDAVTGSSLSAAEILALDERFRGFEVFTWCATCRALLIAAESHDTYLGKSAVRLAQIHRGMLHHDVYVGPTIRKHQ